jgi:hypothetical protein
MTSNRKKCLETIRANIGVPVELITDETLEDYILSESPLHPGFQYLSPTTQCDYFRTYLMHYYGGGYTDIKLTFQSWLPHFQRLSSEPDKYVQGYREVGEGGVARLRAGFESIQETLSANWQSLIGNGAFICKPQSPFTAAWLGRLNKEMDFYMLDLLKYPARHQRDHLGMDLGGQPSKFPIPWAGIAGAIFHPLCFEFKGSILYELPPVICSNYI